MKLCRCGCGESISEKSRKTIKYGHAKNISSAVLNFGNYPLTSRNIEVIMNPTTKGVGTMSLVIAMKSREGIVLAADSRGTIGDPRGLTAINDTYQKIFPLGKCGIGFVGAAELGESLYDELKKNGMGSYDDVNTALEAIAPAVTNYFNQWFQTIPHAQRPGVLVTLAGYRHVNRQAPEPMLYMLASQTNFARQLFRDVCMSGVPQYAVYLKHRYYDQSTSLDKAKALVDYLIAETASQDPKVGGRIRIAEIIPGHDYRELAVDEVAVIHQANEQLNQQLRQFFLAGGAR